MEFRCRLGTPGGEIIEGVYVADSEDRLRREFEEKGLYVLAIQRAGRLAFGSIALPTRSTDCDPRVPGLQPGAGDAAQGRHAARAVARHPAAPGQQPVLQVGTQRRLRSRACRQLAVGVVRGARGALSRRLHGVAHGRREERQPRAGHPPLRRLRQSGRGRPSQGHLGADLSGGPLRALGHRRGHPGAAGRAAVRRLLRAVRQANCRCRRGSSWRFRRTRRPTSVCWCSPWWRSRWASGCG